MRDLDTRTWVKVQDRLAEYAEVCTRKWLTEDGARLPTIRKLARRYKVSQSMIEEMVEDHEDLDLIVGMQIQGVGYGTYDSLGDYRVEWIGEEDE